jgi:hypothetical protein
VPWPLTHAINSFYHLWSHTCWSHLFIIVQLLRYLKVFTTTFMWGWILEVSGSLVKTCTYIIETSLAMRNLSRITLLLSCCVCLIIFTSWFLAKLVIRLTSDLRSYSNLLSDDLVQNGCTVTCHFTSFLAVSSYSQSMTVARINAMNMVTRSSATGQRKSQSQACSRLTRRLININSTTMSIASKWNY